LREKKKKDIRRGGRKDAETQRAFRSLPAAGRQADRFFLCPIMREVYPDAAK
jgi:hypothetical protein